MVTSPPKISDIRAETLNLAEQPETVWPIEISYYTDPLCSWSWAIEPQWRRLRYEFGDRLIYRYVMGGLLPDWQQFNDPLNDICRPIQMTPVWVQIKRLTEMPLNERIWVDDPPASSYPACIAVKAAQHQGINTADAYLRRLREAVMMEGCNISRQDVLLSLAEEVSQNGTLDFQQFQDDLESSATLEAFRQDIKDLRYRGIGRFPSLVLRPPSGQGVLMMGFRPYKVLRDAIAQLAPECQPLRTVEDAVTYACFWGRITAKEVAEALEIPREAAQTVLDEAVEQGTLTKKGLIYCSH